MRPSLAILTTRFGTNFSGGSTATCEIFSRLENSFSSVEVIAKELGKHDFTALNWLQYRNMPGALRHIRSLDKHNTVFYADFYNAWWYTLSGTRFFFTYHDNWPELAALNWRFRLQSWFYWTAYQRIFSHAEHVITVSQRKSELLQPLARHVSLVRNGFNTRVPATQSPRREHVLMVGNIDTRKYSQAIALFRQLPGDPGFRVDIYGHPHDAAITHSLRQFPFVNLMGYHPSVPYASYQLLLHTSLMENLSLVWCEALAQKTPVLAFDVGAAREVIGPGCGHCVNCYDLEAMLVQLRQYAKASDALATTPAHLAEYNWDRAAQRYQAIMFDKNNMIDNE